MGWGLLNPWAMIGLAGITIPVIIHLINRSRFLPMPWGAMLFLRRAIAVRARRVKLEHIVLLAIRCALLGLFALALAGPYLTKRRDLPGGGLDRTQPASAAIVLDTSFSMSARPEGQRETRLELAADMASRLIAGLPNGSDVALLATGQLRPGDKPEPTHDLERARGEATAAHVGMASLPVPDAVEMALKAMERSARPNREVFVLSDACRHGWVSDRPELWRFLGEQRQGMRPDPKVFLVRLAPEDAPAPENLSISDLQSERAVPDVFMPCGFLATVKNHGERPRDSVLAEFRVDGRKKASRQIEIRPRSAETVRFAHQFSEPGSHVIEVRIEGDDLPADNRFLLAVEAADSLPVLLVDGNPDPSFLRSETGFLSLALAPPADRPDAGGALIRTTVIDSPSLAKSDLSKFRVVVLANVAAVDPDAYVRLQAFLRDGGGVLIAPGDRVDPDEYNRALFRGGEGFLPCRMGKAKGDENRRDVFSRISLAGGDHPALACFGTRGSADISRGRVFRWFPLKAERMDLQTRTAASLGESDPFLAEKAIGRGRAILLACPLSEGWSDLPIHPFYVPLTQGLAQSLAGNAGAPRNVVLGATLTWTGKLDQVPEDGQWEVVGPEGKADRLAARRDFDRLLVEHDKARAPGLYSFTCRGKDGTEKTFHFVVRHDTAESDMSPLAKEGFESLAKELGAAPVVGWDGLKAAFESEEQRVSWWPAALLFAVALLVIEVAATNRFARSEKRSGSESSA